MLTKEICEKIWHCHREIEAATNLMGDVKEAIKENKDRLADHEHDEKLRDVFGRRRDLELGVPSGENAKRLFNVSYDLAVPVIKAHIANKTAQLAELNERAKLELAHY